MNDNIIQTINTAMKAGLPVLLVGHTGTGKTTIVRELAAQKKKQLIRVSITGDTTVDDLVGKYELESGNTSWRDGVLTKAVREGHWLVVDEVNMAGGDITAAMHSLLDDDKFITLIQHESEVVKAHKDFRLFATMNPSHASNEAE
jgi:cobaltochelatase CobS